MDLSDIAGIGFYSWRHHYSNIRVQLFTTLRTQSSDVTDGCLRNSLRVMSSLRSGSRSRRYLYCDEELIDSDNVLSVLYCCKKYNVQSLLTKCVDFVKQTMSVDNVCSLLEQAHIFDEQQLYQSCLSFIHQQGATVLQTDGFQELSRACVLDVISSNSLACQEHIVFVAMLRWAEAECKRQSKHVQDSTMRVVLGELVFQIRFGLLDMSYYSAQVSTRQILYDAEKLELFQAISGTTVRGMKFNGKQRNCPQRYESCRRGLKIF
ncbi:BTB/POZ domain-containing protein 2-like isoform X3 [Haliotis rufescens]|uniref:BTB/POZ domain-containing protein 2-like isoform X3 n=1 Tax=Haliotis rufescens TaxID=6454 RepID=UPI00201F4CEC|nr:BTB/POZ domain-containing protein 2-like isoform X3 [Haliotis rufescens]